MPIPWLTVLSSVPWSQVIKNAPAVADGARKLWGAATKRGEAQAVPPPAREPTAADAAKDPEIGALLARIEAMQATLAEHQDQLLASSELIKALAEQNAQLIQRIEMNRIRLRWVGIACAVLALVSATGVILALR